MNARPKPPLVGDPFYQRLKSLVIERTGMAFYADRDDDLVRILDERFRATGVADCASYLERVADKAELEELIAELTIGETYFFRYKEQFEALRDLILPEVIDRNRERRTLRIWSAGCATGPEPYTVAIILRQRFGHLLDNWDVTVLGTDINQRFLARARDGIYDDWAFRATPEAVRNTCFEPVAKRWRINPEYRSWVKFRYHNLVDDPFPSLAQGIVDFDVIMCRNVVIYFTTETFRRILGRFRDTLVDDGWLVIGHSEHNDSLFRAFRPVEAPGAVLYRKSDVTPAPVLPPLLPAPEPVVEPVSLAALLAEPATYAVPSAEPPDVAEPPAAPPPEPPAAPLLELRRMADRGSWHEVGRLVRRMLQDEPLEPLLHLFNGLAQEHAGEAAAAVESMRRAVYLDRTLALAHYHLGRLLADQGEGEAAARSFRNALRLASAAAADAIVPGSEDMAAAELVGLLRLHVARVGG